MNWLWGIVATAGVILSQEGGKVDRVVREVGGMLRATHMDGDRIRAYFGRCRKAESARALESLGMGYRPR